MQSFFRRAGDAGLRARRARQGYTNLVVQELECNPVSPVTLGRLPCCVFLVVGALFLTLGMICCVTAPQSPRSAVGEDFPDTAFCMRAQRQPNYVKVELALGTPARIVPALFRPDKIVPRGSSALRVFSPRTVESRTLRCTGMKSNCSDVLLVTRGTSSRIDIMSVSFDYINHDVEEATYGVARYYMRMEAEVNAIAGARYWLTTTHLCIDPNPVILSTKEGALLATVETVYEQNQTQTKLVTQASALVRLDESLFNDAMAHSAHRTGACVNTSGELTTVELFPHQASLEHYYLALGDLTLYESEPSAVETRRSIVEMGYMCAIGIDWMSHGYQLWVLDCRALGRCRAGPSLPWRRVTTNDMRAHYVSSTEVYFWFEPRKALRSMPGLQQSETALAISIIKLALITLVAATIWIRADRATSASDWLYRHCVEAAHCVDATKMRYSSNTVSISEDAMLGLLCIAARGGVIMWWRDVLLEDDQRRIVVFEIAATVLSLVHWSARYLMLEPNIFQLKSVRNHHDDPLTRIGGSSAVVDGAMGVLVLYARTPLIVNEGGFDATARLLTGTLVALVSLQRSLFALCCCSLLIEASKEALRCKDQAYEALLWFGVAFWTLQISSIAVALCDLVATPMAGGMMRAQNGERTPIICVVFLVLVALGMPRLMQTSVKLIRYPKVTRPVQLVQKILVKA